MLKTALAILTALLVLSCNSKSTIYNKPVLKINSTEITTKQFSDRLALKLRDYDALFAKDETNLKRAKDQTIQEFIVEVMTRDYATANKITVSDAEVEKEVDQLRSHYPNDNAFRRSLAQENLAYEEWRKSLSFTLLQKKVFEAVTKGRAEPSEADEKAYFDAKKTEFQAPARIMLRQIVLEKEADAKRIMTQLQDGGDFTRLAKEFSVAPEGANGGNTGWIDKGTLDVFDQAFKLNVGTRSKIVKSPYGYHIYEVLKKEPEAHLNFQTARAKIQRTLKERSAQAIFSSWLEQQARKTTVYRNDELIQAIKVTTRGN